MESPKLGSPPVPIATMAPRIAGITVSATTIAVNDRRPIMFSIWDPIMKKNIIPRSAQKTPAAGGMR